MGRGEGAAQGEQQVAGHLRRPPIHQTEHRPQHVGRAVRDEADGSRKEEEEEPLQEAAAPWGRATMPWRQKEPTTEVEHIF